MKRQIVAIATAVDTPALLPHFTRHYLKLGVDRLVLVITDHEQQGLASVSEDIASAEPRVSVIKADPGAKYSDGDKGENEQDALRQLHLDPDDFILHLDIDEFHQYPADLRLITDAMDEKGIDAVQSFFVDRVAVTGRLDPVRGDLHLGAQFPWGCYLSANLLRADTQKIMLCRHRFYPGWARHRVDGARVDNPIPGRYCVHHFKWTSGVLERLRRRVREGNLHPKYHEECRRFLRYFSINDKINVLDPQLNQWSWINGMRDE